MERAQQKRSVTKIYFMLNILLILLYAWYVEVLFAFTKAAVATNAVRTILFAYLHSCILFLDNIKVLNYKYICRRIIFKLYELICERSGSQN